MWAILVSAAVVQQPPKCAVDATAMLKLSPEDFDQTQKGWRSIGDKPECNLAAADLIGSYRIANWSKLTPSQVQLSYWHEGQARAMGGQTDKAIPFLLAGVNPTADTELSPFALAFSEYAIATVAFLQKDLATLKTARARLAAIPEPSKFKEFKQNSPPELREHVKWPMNLGKVDGLILCFDEPYAEAYGCDSKHQGRTRP
jgi:hypothetical protein